MLKSKFKRINTTKTTHLLQSLIHHICIFSGCNRIGTRIIASEYQTHQTYTATVHLDIRGLYHGLSERHTIYMFNIYDYVIRTTAGYPVWVQFKSFALRCNRNKLHYFDKFPTNGSRYANISDT